ncbi:dUTP diphosphatase [Spiroplasma endosymbiont of Panorpa germanica]|uniref:dUTP diphosphatase n=1 Tax=Spiroplasma endosymbiont of Panorpa germanica TaxID=3066314 RepID=UPI0030CC897F
MIGKKTLVDLAKRQKKLDNYIYEKKQIKFSNQISNKKMIAFFVELGEFINEERSFKFWSQKPASPRNVLLEEYIDGLHFILSIGLEIGFDFENFESDNLSKQETLEQEYLQLISFFSQYSLSKDSNNFTILMNSFFKIGSWFDFSEQELLDTYFRKNEINFKRQENQY